ncbi:MAG: alpha/beta fold hydrolase [Gammaproteobacteria bacterium]|nr:alpha/beta fold hydrolase [Gammaproteobacteria bacterium]
MRMYYKLMLILFNLPLVGCSFLPESVIPLKSISQPAPKPSDTLVVFLPGLADDEQTFVKEKFFSAVSDRKKNIDLMAVHTHIGYLLDGTYAERIKEDVILPARKKGYKKIWLVGVSLGGFISVNYLRQQPDDVTGLILFGPFLGQEGQLKEIKKQGGVLKWQPEDVESLSKTLSLWYWFKQNQKKYLKNIYVNYGDKDKLAYGIKMFSPLINKSHITEIKGIHGWKTWRELWHMLLDSKTSPL